MERIEAEGQRRDVVILKREKGSVSELMDDEGYGNDKGKLQPTDIGTLVTDYLVGHFDRVMSYQFTAEIESEFDAILTDELDWTEMLKRFYQRFHPKIESAQEDDERINEERHLGDDPKTGKPIYSKIGRLWAFCSIGR